MSMQELIKNKRRYISANRNMERLVTVIRGIEPFARSEDVVMFYLLGYTESNPGGFGLDPEGLPWLNEQHTLVGIRPSEREIKRVTPHLEDKLIDLIGSGQFYENFGFVAAPFFAWVEREHPGSIFNPPTYAGNWEKI